MLTGSDLDKKENIHKAIMGIDPKKLTSFCVELAESLNEIYSSLYKDDLDNKFTLITRAWINEPTGLNKEKALDFAKASRGYCRIASVEAGRHYSENNFNHYLSCASILECCYYALMTIKKPEEYVALSIREYILAREMIVRDFDKDDREEYVNSFKDGIVEKLNEIKERHDQQVDSGDNYDDVLESPVGMISYQDDGENSIINKGVDYVTEEDAKYIGEQIEKSLADTNKDKEQIASELGAVYSPCTKENTCQEDVDHLFEIVDEVRSMLNEEFNIEVDQPYTPEVGEECEISNCGNPYIWCKIEYMGNDLCVVSHEIHKEQHYHLNSAVFRPLKTERDLCMDAIKEGLNQSVWEAQIGYYGFAVDKLIKEGMIKNDN